MKSKSVLFSRKAGAVQLDFITLALLVFALASLIFAFLSLQKSDEIVKNLSTRYIGEFPFFLPNVVKELESARRSIYIAKDFPGYGIYSNHQEYLNYVKVLQQKLTERVEIKMVVLADNRRLEMHDLQFKGVTIDQLKKSDYFQNFVRWSGQNPEDIRNMEDFKSALAEEQRRACREDFRNIYTKEFDGHMPVYLWIVDDSRAILSFPSLVGGAKEGALFTRDGKLIPLLLNTFNMYFTPEQTSEHLRFP